MTADEPPAKCRRVIERSPSAEQTPRRVQTHTSHPPLVARFGTDFVGLKDGSATTYTEARRSSIKSVLDEFQTDLCTADGKIVSISRAADRKSARCEVLVENVSERFLGWPRQLQVGQRVRMRKQASDAWKTGTIVTAATGSAPWILEELTGETTTWPFVEGEDSESDHMVFVLKSTIAQLGINGVGSDYQLFCSQRQATLVVALSAISHAGVLALDSIGIGCYIGKLFSPNRERRVTEQDFLERSTSRLDRLGRQLIKVPAEMALKTEMRDGRLVAHVPLLPGTVSCDSGLYGLMPTVGKALAGGKKVKHLLKLHQVLNQDSSKLARPLEMLMVRAVPFVIRNCFARVVEEMLPSGLRCFTSNLIENTENEENEGTEGRTFCFFGESMEELTSIPLEFYRLEAWRDHSILAGSHLLHRLDNDHDAIFKALETMPKAGALAEFQASVFVVKGEFLDGISTEDWIVTNPTKYALPKGTDLSAAEQKGMQLRRYSRQQSTYAIFKAISAGDINSQGVLLTRFFPSTTMKYLLLSDNVSAALKRIYFVKASRSEGDYFSQGDRNMLIDLHDFGIEVYCIDPSTKRIFKFTCWQGRDSGLFVPTHRQHHYLNATFLGVYGSNLVAGGNDETELRMLVQGLKDMRAEMQHPLIRADKPLALVTGGGPGAMEVGNRVARECGVLSCGCVCDFRPPKDKGAIVNEQKRNQFVDAWMTYRLEKLVERQSEFNLDLPIFLTGGIGTDFELSLEEVRRKVGTQEPTPMILLGTVEFWRGKIYHRFEANKKAGTVKGSEWITNCYYIVQTAKQALKVYRLYFSGQLVTGKKGKIHDDGFCVVPSDGPELDAWQG
eukprot:TRINITY_DN82999_c0_g1_i1.p1 TRINITY_DN82999_c0_g1~~TRINITY_DN82999_c0_g1_i1.p1  ORF type:complete len:843 (-),score=216.55 TRINITY_DN82999_c0_g1_i1:139-2667(-)